jgi:hypothetical protein
MAGAEECIANFQTIITNVNTNVKKAVDDVDSQIFSLSRDTMCPIDKGPLRASAKDEIHETDTEYFHELSYETPYCWWVHELPYHHQSPTQRKFLETPVDMYKQKLVDDMRSAFSEAL